jgi:polyhydroxyalkanoate synthase
MGALIAGIQAYRAHPFHRNLPDPPEIWSEGSSRLLDYGGPEGRGIPLLIVPSLINRAYILDLTERTSLLRWLGAEGFRPILVDWGRPGPEERRFTLTDYIAGRLERALDWVLAAAGRPPLVVGYCMGGLLAVALALRRPGDISGLALLATPWNFHADQGAQGRFVAASLASFAPLLDALGELPVDPIQALFAALDPQLVIRKFLAFSRLDPKGAKARAFVALEDWLNDGVPLAAPVARECLAGWYGENTTAKGLWRVAGRAVAPAALDLPAICLIPAQDRIVPPDSAAALAEAIPGAEILTPPAGHIGMVASARAPKQVWRPLARWLAAHQAG